jgi:hypothetical protein
MYAETERYAKNHQQMPFFTGTTGAYDIVADGVVG